MCVCVCERCVGVCKVCVLASVRVMCLGVLFIVFVRSAVGIIFAFAFIFEFCFFCCPISKLCLCVALCLYLKFVQCV